jgi:hypothetical protein
MLDTNYERAAESGTSSPTVEQQAINVCTFRETPAIEDSMGGLEGVFTAEKQDAVSINRITYFYGYSKNIKSKTCQQSRQ